MIDDLVPMTSLPLEDGFTDVLGKALRGTGRTIETLAEETGVPLPVVQSTLDGSSADPANIAILAAALGLAPERVVALAEGSYQPAEVTLDGVHTVTTPFHDMQVNAYLVWDAATREAALFDTGTDGDGLLAFARERGLRVDQIFITHGHGDHIYDLDRLIEKTGAAAFVPEGEGVGVGEEFAAGREFRIGNFEVQTRLTCGHAPAGITYVVRGLACPLALCGDALFAGSMGGGMISYADALRTNREAIFSLPDDTVLASGHGPLTTVGEQRRHNPFFPEEVV